MTKPTFIYLPFFLQEDAEVDMENCQKKVCSDGSFQTLNECTSDDRVCVDDECVCNDATHYTMGSDCVPIPGMTVLPNLVYFYGNTTAERLQHTLNSCKLNLFQTKHKLF